MGLRVQGLGFRVQGLGLRVQGLGFAFANELSQKSSSGLRLEVSLQLALYSSFEMG